LTGAVWSTFREVRVAIGAIGLKDADTNEILETNDSLLICSVTKKH
tara:strand:- start:128 stop:265 length:138 start_codon:yes stop_codon:yes gene_type:complete